MFLSLLHDWHTQVRLQMPLLPFHLKTVKGRKQIRHSWPQFSLSILMQGFSPQHFSQATGKSDCSQPCRLMPDLMAMFLSLPFMVLLQIDIEINKKIMIIISPINLLGLVAFPGGVVGVLDMRVRTRPVRVLQEQVDVAFAVDQDFILDHASLLEILQLGEGALLVVQLEHSLGFLGRAGESAQDQGLVLGDPDDHEPPQGNGQFQFRSNELVLGDDVSLDGVESADFFVVAAADQDFIVVDPACCALASRCLHVGDGEPFLVHNVKALGSLHLHFVLSIVAPEHVHPLRMVNRGEEVPKTWHLLSRVHQLFVGLENSEIFPCRTSKQEVGVFDGDEDDREMQRKLFPLAARVDFPLLPVDAEPSNAGASELKPIAAFVEHQRRVFVIVLLGSGFHLVFLLLFPLLFLGDRHGPRRLQGVGVGVALVDHSLGEVVVALVVKSDVLVAWLVVLLAVQFLLQEQRFDFAEGRPVGFLEAQQDREQLAETRRVSFLQHLQILPDQFFSVHLQSLGIESRHFVHQSQLGQHKPRAEHVGLVDVMLSEPRTAVDHVGLPQDGRQVLRGASDRGHGECLPVFVVGVVEIVLALSEVDELELVVGEEEDVGRLDVPVADALGLEKGAGGDHAGVHGDELDFLPVDVGFLPLPVDVLQVGLLVHELGDDAQLEGAVLGFGEVVAVELDHVGMVLHLHQLHCLFLVLIQFVQILRLDFLQGVELPCAQVHGFVDLRVFLARAQHLQPFEVGFLEHGCDNITEIQQCEFNFLNPSWQQNLKSPQQKQISVAAGVRPHVLLQEQEDFPLPLHVLLPQLRRHLRTGQDRRHALLPQEMEDQNRQG